MVIGILLKQEIEHTFQMVPDRCTTEELFFLCPECGDRGGNRGVNLKTGQTNCWRCGKGKNNVGHFVAWASKLGYRFNNEAGSSNVPIEELLKPVKHSRTRLPVVTGVQLPEGFTLCSDEPDSYYTKKIADMAERKNLEIFDLMQAGVGFTRLDPLWEPFAIFPVHEFNVPVYYQGRTYQDPSVKEAVNKAWVETSDIEPFDVFAQSFGYKDFHEFVLRATDKDYSLAKKELGISPKTKKFPSKKALPNGARYWLYNYDELRNSKAHTALVVESILNVLSLKKQLKKEGIEGIVPVAAFKHKISPEQFTKLLRCKHLKEMCLLFDHDAIDVVWDSSSAFTNHLRVTVAEMPAGKNNDKLDPNDDVVAAMDAFDARKDFTSGGALKNSFTRAAKEFGGKKVADMSKISFS